MFLIQRVEAIFENSLVSVDSLETNGRQLAMCLLSLYPIRGETETMVPVNTVIQGRHSSKVGDKLNLAHSPLQTSNLDKRSTTRRVATTAKPRPQHEIEPHRTQAAIIAVFVPPDCSSPIQRICLLQAVSPSQERDRRTIASGVIKARVTRPGVAVPA